MSSQPPAENRLAFPAQPSFWGYARVGEYLRLADVNVANLANNYALDYGRWGLDQTISELGGKGIFTVGAEDGHDVALVEITREYEMTRNAEAVLSRLA